MLTHRTVLFGLGRMGRHHHRTILESPHFDLFGVVDPAKELSPISDDFDVAVVASSTDSHYELTKELLSAGKHVLVEKPLARTHAECVELVELSKEKGVQLAVGHVERFNPAIRKLREMIDLGFLGEPVYALAVRTSDASDCRGILLDLAIHEVDILNHLICPIEVASKLTHPNGDATLELSPAGMIHVSYQAKKIRVLRLTGTHGDFFVDYIRWRCFDMAHGELDVHKGDPLTAQLESFHRLIIGEDFGPLCLGWAAAEAVRLVTK